MLDAVTLKSSVTASENAPLSRKGLGREREKRKEREKERMPWINYGAIGGSRCSLFIFFIFSFSFTHIRINISASCSKFPIRSATRSDMATIDLQHLSLLLIALLAAALTSSVNAGPDGISSSISSDSSPKSSTIEHRFDFVGDKKASKSWDSGRLAEGGPISISTTTQHANIKSSTVDGLNKPDESRTRENVPKERHDNPFARKEKIKPRKGVDQNMDPQVTNVSFNQTISKNTESVMETASAETVHVNSQFETSTTDTLKLNVTNLHVNNSLDHSMNSNTSLMSANTTTSHTEATNHTTPKASSHIEKHIPKPKPIVTTVDGLEPNESRLSSRTKNPPLGMPRKIDYIVPVIITIIALPILGAIIFVLYRRGRDCWDKRHYRRMDFLIDGMYND